MSFFKKPVVEAVHESDSLGGFSRPDTGIYQGHLKRIFGDTYGSGAQFMYLEIETDKKQTQIHRVLVTKADGSNTFTNQKTNEEQVLQGYALMDSLCLVTVGQPLSAIEWEEHEMDVKVDGKDVKEIRLVPAGLWGQPVQFAVEKALKNKQVKGDDNKYYNTNDSEEDSEITKFFHVESNQTATEMINEAEASFINKWKAKHLDENGVGITANRFKEVKDAPKAGAVPTKKPAGSLPVKPGLPGKGLPGLPRKS